MSDLTIYDRPRRMRGWTVEATCRVCGGVLEHVADGRPDGVTSRAVARCTVCRLRWRVEIRIVATKHESERLRMHEPRDVA